METLSFGIDCGRLLFGQDRPLELMCSPQPNSLPFNPIY
jgi:hypothetical protein